MPLFDPALHGADALRIVVDYHPGQGLAPFAMPLAVSVERIEDLAEQIVTFAQREMAQVAHEYLVHQGLEHEVQRNESFSPVVTNQQFLNRDAQRLPERIGLPARLAIGGETTRKSLKLPDPVGNS